ncbi:TrbI/VirB10 family protein [Solimonas terrae]|uniref:TrbI/VirB10 family protein n=1 Tax=Solimonas terrae TaxID=1396819 RepID=A0A6M2BU51_9GAMM|nr:TrbI/VirB10 family protein [Solimonas terrae]NGY05904.1 TrbI/VirB10 family protein [Solimonas terrae]
MSTEAAPPKADPESLSLRASPRPVMRLSRRMLAVLAGSLAALVLGATLWSLRPRARSADAPAASELYNVDRVSRAENLDELPANYAQLPPKPVAPPALGEPLPGDLGPAVVHARSAGVGRYGGSAGPDEAEAARHGALFFRAANQASRAAGAAGAAVGAAAKAEESVLMPSANLSLGSTAVGPDTQTADPTTVQNRQEQKEAFLAKASSGGTRSLGGLQLPASPYQVMAGTVIAAALITGIQSDLPGDVVASVTEPVYDTATGRFVLIPQGSRLLGRYNSQVSYGQSRVQVVWNRIVLPDTSSFELDNLVGTDPAGHAGLEDGVDWHGDRVFAGAALTTLLGVGAELAAPENRNDGNRVIVAGRDSAQDSVNQVGQEMTRRNLNIQPTLTERPGLPVRVIVHRDLALRPYQPLFFQRGESP